MFGQGREIVDLSLGAIDLDLPQPHIVVAACRRQTAAAGGLKMGGIDGCVLVVPIDDEGRCLHRDSMRSGLGGLRVTMHMRSWKAEVEGLARRESEAGKSRKSRK